MKTPQMCGKPQVYSLCIYTQSMPTVSPLSSVSPVRPLYDHSHTVSPDHLPLAACLVFASLPYAVGHTQTPDTQPGVVRILGVVQ